MKLTKHIIIKALFIWLIPCLSFVACQKPSAGDLKPVLTENGSLTTSRFENDTVVSAHESLTVKIFGKWESGIGLNIAVNNQTGKDVVVRFDRMQVVNRQGETAAMGSLIEKANDSYKYWRNAPSGGIRGEKQILNSVNGGDDKREIPQIKVFAKSERKFSAGFTNIFDFGADGKAAENVLDVTLPIEIEGEKPVVKLFKAAFEKSDKIGKNVAEPEGW